MIERLGMRIVAGGIVALGVLILAYLTSGLFVYLAGYVAAVLYLRRHRLVVVDRLRLHVYLEPRDWWIGAYVHEAYVYVCPAPCVVLRFTRSPDRRP